MVVVASAGRLLRGGRGSCSPGEHQGAPQQLAVDGGRHGAPVGLALGEGAGRLQPGELVGVGVGLGQPGGGGGAERCRHVQLGDVLKAGGAQQPLVVAAHRDRPGAGGTGAPPRRRCQARHFQDRGERCAPAGAQQPPARSQHGELGA
jgi:hypothetical protein